MKAGLPASSEDVGSAFNAVVLLVSPAPTKLTFTAAPLVDVDTVKFDAINSYEIPVNLFYQVNRKKGV